VPAELLPIAVLLAITPGYLLIYFATQGRTGRELRPDLHLIIQSLVASAGLLAVIAPFAYATMWPVRSELDHHPWDVLGWLVAIFLFVPFVLGRAARIVGDLMADHPQGGGTGWLHLIFGHAPEPSMWDWAEGNNVMDNRFVVIEYRDGRRIAGAHGRPGVTFTSPEPHSIYLAVEYEVSQGGQLMMVTDTAGVLVPITDDVRSVHLFTEPGAASMPSTAQQRPRPQRPDAPEHEERGRRPHREDPPSRPPRIPPPEPRPEPPPPAPPAPAESD